MPGARGKRPGQLSVRQRPSGGRCVAEQCQFLRWAREIKLRKGLRESVVRLPCSVRGRSQPSPPCHRKSPVGRVVVGIAVLLVVVMMGACGGYRIEFALTQFTIVQGHSPRYLALTTIPQRVGRGSTLRRDATM